MQSIKLKTYTPEQVQNIREHTSGYIFGEDTKYLSDAEIIEIVNYKDRIAEIYNSKVYPHKKKKRE